MDQETERIVFDHHLQHHLLRLSWRHRHQQLLFLWHWGEIQEHQEHLKKITLFQEILSILNHLRLHQILLPVLAVIASKVLFVHHRLLLLLPPSFLVLLTLILLLHPVLPLIVSRQESQVITKRNQKKESKKSKLRWIRRFDNKKKFLQANHFVPNKGSSSSIQTVLRRGQLLLRRGRTWSERRRPTTTMMISLMIRWQHRHQESEQQLGQQKGERLYWTANIFPSREWITRRERIIRISLSVKYALLIRVTTRLLILSVVNSSRSLYHPHVMMIMPLLVSLVLLQFILEIRLFHHLRTSSSRSFLFQGWIKRVQIILVNKHHWDILFRFHLQCQSTKRVLPHHLRV